MNVDIKKLQEDIKMAILTAYKQGYSEAEAAYSKELEKEKILKARGKKQAECEHPVDKRLKMYKFSDEGEKIRLEVCDECNLIL